MTNNPNARFSYHLSCDGTNPEKDAWVKELRKSGMKPIMEIIEIIYDGREATFKREQYWIKYYLALGCALFNMEADRPRDASKIAKTSSLSSQYQRDVVKQSTPMRLSPFLRG